MAGPNYRTGGSGNPFGIHRAPNPQALQERRIRSLELRIQGMTIHQISRAVGVTAAIVSKDIRKVLEERAVQATEEGRAMERERLQTLHARAWTILEDVSNDAELKLKAIDRLVRIAERRSKLEGYDSPTRVDATVHEVTQQDLELQELLREAQASNSAVIQQIKQETAGPDAVG